MPVCGIGALVQSMVDGVIVMNSQVWLALVVGWLLALHVGRSAPTAAVGMGGMESHECAGRRSVDCDRGARRPHITQAQQQYLGGGNHLQPRFWAQGVIAR
jgi:hypothetical protein